MNQTQFQTQVGRLKKAYGALQVHEEFIALLWRRVSDRDSYTFEKAVDQIIEERMPLKMSVIIETLRAKEKTYAKSEFIEPARVDEPVRASDLADSLKKRLRIISGGAQ